MKKEMTLLEFLNSRSYLSAYDYDEDGLLLISNEDDTYNILYAVIVDSNGYDIEADYETILNTVIDDLIFYETSFELNYPDEKTLDDFIKTKMFQL